MDSVCFNKAEYVKLGGTKGGEGSKGGMVAEKTGADLIKNIVYLYETLRKKKGKYIKIM